MNQTNRIALLQKAEDAARKGDYEEALGVVSRCLDLYPGFSPARVVRSEILARTGKRLEAITELREVIAANPENIRARMILMDLLIKEQNLEQASMHLEFLSFMMPENDPALLELSQRVTDLQSAPAEEPVYELDEPVSEGETEPVDGEWAGQDAVKAGREIESEEDTAVLMADDFLSAREASVEGQSQLRQEDWSDTVSEPLPADLVKEDTDLEELDDEMVDQEEIITVHLDDMEKAPTVDVEDGVEIKTRTMAKVYEQQGMLNEARAILRTLHEQTGSEDLLQEIQRIDDQEKQRKSSRPPSGRQRVIDDLTSWLEKVKCSST